MSEQFYFLEDRVAKIEAFTGVEEGVTLPAPTKLADRIQESILKLPKDIQAKYEKIKKLINTYSRVTEDLLIEEKVETIASEEEQLNEVAQELEEIEQLTKYLNMEQLFGLNSKTADIRLLSSASKLEVQMRIIEFIDVKEPLKAVEFSSLELQQLAEQHRNQFEQLVLLNSSIVASLNQRVRAIDSRIAELERK